MRWWWLIIWLAGSWLALTAQQVIRPMPGMSNLNGAVLLHSDTVLITASPTGFGIPEISAPRSSTVYLEKEHHSLWLKIVPPMSCIYSFDLVPGAKADDWDFMLFAADSLRLDEVASMVPLRTNKARNKVELGSTTGLSEQGRDAFVGEGPGNNFSTPLRLKAGHEYFLLLDNVYSSKKGCRLYFHKKACLSPEREYKTALIPLRISVRDKEKETPLSARVTLIKSDIHKPDTLIDDKGFAVIKKIAPGFYYELYVRAPDHLSYKEEFKVYREDSAITKDIDLQAIAPGKTLVIDNIYFVGGRADIMRKSYPALRKLLFMLKDNPRLKIELQGHVNQPYNTRKKHKEKYYRNLSEQRAKAVYDYLIKRGIDAQRLSYKGYGYSHMLYPFASNPDEMEKNRRVEIEILQM